MRRSSGITTMARPASCVLLDGRSTRTVGPDAVVRSADANSPPGNRYTSSGSDSGRMVQALNAPESRVGRRRARRFMAETLGWAGGRAGNRGDFVRIGG